MKVLFAGFKYEYGRREWGIANIEYANFFGSLEKMPGVEARFFAVDEVMSQAGRDAMNELLIKNVNEQKPDLLFTMIFQEEIKKETIAYITKKTPTKTFNWFADDHWRLPVFSRFWAPLFTMVGTTDSQAPARYASYGINNVIKTQWGVNQWLYKPIENRKIEKYNNIKISFVGKKYGKRGKYIADLKKAGLNAEGFGKGWNGGAVDFKTMLGVFSNSKISLNFTESPYVTFGAKIKLLAKMLIAKENGKYRLNLDPLSQLESAAGAQRRQIKARIFEIPAAKGFLMTQSADNLSDYYIDGKEAIIWKTQEELIEKARYYLANEQEREAIAQAGYERTIKEHTYEQRFGEIFKKLNLM